MQEELRIGKSLLTIPIFFHRSLLRVHRHCSQAACLLQAGRLASYHVLFFRGDYGQDVVSTSERDGVRCSHPDDEPSA